MKIQIIGGKVYLREKGETLLGDVNKLKKCPAMFCLYTSSKLSHNLNFHRRWRWWDQIQATFKTFSNLLSYACTTVLWKELRWSWLNCAVLNPLVCNSQYTKSLERGRRGCRRCKDVTPKGSKHKKHVRWSKTYEISFFWQFLSQFIRFELINTKRLIFDTQLCHLMFYSTYAPRNLNGVRYLNMARDWPY